MKYNAWFVVAALVLTLACSRGKPITSPCTKDEECGRDLVCSFGYCMPRQDGPTLRDPCHVKCESDAIFDQRMGNTDFSEDEVARRVRACIEDCPPVEPTH